MAEWKASSGIIVAVGPGLKLISENGVVAEPGMSVKVNDRINFIPNGAAPFEMEGEDYLLMKEHNIIGVTHREEND
jgi:co-chaperonin GroES (HSP10)